MYKKATLRELFDIHPRPWKLNNEGYVVDAAEHEVDKDVMIAFAIDVMNAASTSCFQYGILSNCRQRSVGYFVAHDGKHHPCCISCADMIYHSLPGTSLHGFDDEHDTEYREPK